MSEINPVTRRSSDFYSTLTMSEQLRSLLSTQVYVPGIDVSHWQGVVNWRQVKLAGYHWAGVKATEGVGLVDDRFEYNWCEMLAAGVIPLPYHFFRMNRDGNEQADFHRQTIAGLIAACGGRILPSAVDVETQDGVGDINTRRSRLKACLVNLAANPRRPDWLPVIYSSKSLWLSLIGSVDWADDYYGWVAHWTSATEPSLPTGWTRSTTRFWQYGIAGKYDWCPPAVPGVSGQCDVDRFFGTLDELEAFAGLTEPTLEEQVSRLWAAHPELW